MRPELIEVISNRQNAHIDPHLDVWEWQIPAYLFLFIWIGMQLVSQFAISSRTGGGVAYLAHIAGFVAGAALIFVFRRSMGDEDRDQGRGRHRDW